MTADKTSGYDPINKSFSNRVGAEGFSDIDRHKSCGRTAWVLITALAWTLASFDGAQYIMRYYSYPFETVLELNSVQKLRFPTVTVCNLNPALKWKVAEHLATDELSSFMDGEMTSSLNSMFTRPTYKLSNTTTTTTNTNDTAGTSSSTYMHKESAYVIDDDVRVSMQNYGDVDPEVIADMGFENFATSVFYDEYQKLNRDDREAIGHQMERTLVDCFWQGSRCDDSSISNWQHHLYGNCFSFNRDGETWVAFSGQNYGLHLIMNAEAYAYIPTVARSTGMRASVHHYSQAPYPEDYGFTLSTGFSTELEVQQNVIDRINTPYTTSGCRTSYPDTYGDYAHAYYEDAEYSSHGCRKICMQKMMWTECGCMLSQLPTYKIEDTTSIRMCNSKVQADHECYAAVVEIVENDNTTECFLWCLAESCHEVDYQVRINAAVWPNDHYATNLVGDLKTWDDPSIAEKEFWDNENFTDVEKVRKTALELKVYYERLNYQSIQQVESYTYIDMMADIGGTIGLWAGVSVLSFVQIGEYFVELAYYRVNRRYLVECE